MGRRRPITQTPDTSGVIGQLEFGKRCAVDEIGAVQCCSVNNRHAQSVLDRAGGGLIGRPWDRSPSGCSVAPRGDLARGHRAEVGPRIGSRNTPSGRPAPGRARACGAPSGVVRVAGFGDAQILLHGAGGIRQEGPGRARRLLHVPAACGLVGRDGDHARVSDVDARKQLDDFAVLLVVLRAKCPRVSTRTIGCPACSSDRRRGCPS